MCIRDRATTYAGDSAEVRGDTQLRYFNGRLLGMDVDRTVLAWRVNVRTSATDVAIFVDANTGAILFQESRVNEDFDLDLETGNFTGQSPSCWAFTYDDDQWFDEDGPVSSGISPEGYLAFNNIRNVYNYWRGTFSRDSYDDDGEDIAMYIHVDPHPGTASYNGGCDIFEYSTGSADNDIIGHEWTHAVDKNEADLIYANQSGALDESFADIFGHAVDPADWLIGEDLPIGARRSMSAPPTFGDPDHMDPAISGETVAPKGLRIVTNLDAIFNLPLPICGSPPTVPNGNDCGFVHTNSGIHNKVAFLITAGGTHNGRSVTGIGQVNAEQVFFEVLTNCLWSSAQFIDARNCAVRETQRQEQRFGAGSVCAVRNAYVSVGLGSGDLDCDNVEDNVDSDADGDYAPDSIDNCPSLKNLGQADRDRDNVGNACDPDDDNDAVCDVGGPLPVQPGLPPGGCSRGATILNSLGADNCLFDANLTQADGNANGIGDACEDRDGDLYIDMQDNCPDVPNSQQINTDGDSLGDACDPDIDNDGDLNASDNCRFVINPGQENGDLDSFGDACDKCPGIQSNDNGDADNDGRGDPCDPDADNDTICTIGGPLSGLPGLLAGGCVPGARLVRPEGADNCPLNHNPSQLDQDSNGVGLECDAAEHEQLLDKVEEYNERFQFQGPIIVPIGVCPQCGTGYLPQDYTTRLDLQIPPTISARVVDSNGLTVAKSSSVGDIQRLQFEPRAFTGLVLRIGAQAGIAAQQIGSAFDPPPADTRYYLELTPGPDVSPSQIVEVRVIISGGVPGLVYLPLVRH